MAIVATEVPTATVSQANTIAQIKALLDGLGIPYPSSATKTELLLLVPADHLEVDETTPEAPTEAPAPQEATQPEPEPVPAYDPTLYTVVEGDTIAGIATRYGMSVAKLKALNVPLNVLTVGRVLHLA